MPVMLLVRLELENGLRRIFRMSSTQGELRHTRLLRDLCSPAVPGSGFSALGLKFPAFLGKALSLKNVEHALCEFDKYFRSAQGIQVKEREYSSQKSRVGLDTDSTVRSAARELEVVEV